MNNIPGKLKYTRSHEWVRREDDGVATVGITEHAQALLGDMVFVELPETSMHVDAGDEVGVLESVKAASDLYTPVGGEIIEINEAVIDSPALVNSDPYGDGWLFKLSVHNNTELDRLLDASEYAEQIVEDS